MKSSLLDLPFAAGIDQSQRSELLSPAEGWTELENLRQTKRGGGSKRFGFSALALTRTSGSRSAGQRLTSRNGAIVVSDGAKVDIYSPTAALSHVMGQAPVCAVSTQLCESIPDTSRAFPSMHVADVAYCAGYLVVSQLYITAASSTTRAVSANVLDATTFAQVAARNVFETAATLHGGMMAVLSSRYIVLVYAKSGTTSIYGYYFDTSNPTSGWQSIGTLANDWRAAGGNTNFAIHSFGDRIALAYGNTSGGASRLTLTTFNTGGVLETTTVNTGGNDPATEVCGSSTDTLWAIWSEGANVKVEGHTYNAIAAVTATVATVATLPTGLWGISAVHDSSTAGAGYLVTGDQSEQFLITPWTTAAGAVVAGTSRTIRNARAVGRVFEETNLHRFFVPVCMGNQGVGSWEENTENLHVLAEFESVGLALSTLRPYANVYPGLARTGLDPNGNGILAYPRRNTVHNGSRKWFAATGVKRSASTIGTAVIGYDFASSQRCEPAVHGGALFLGGGAIMTCTGGGVQEAGFMARPTKPSTSTGGTGITAVTGWRYVAVYETIDADGNWVVSGISDPSTSTGAVANKTVTVTTRPLPVTHRSDVRIAFYRTADGAVPPYYRLASITNDPTALGNSYADTTADATLTTQAKLYSPSLPSTVGAALDRRAPPGLLHLASYNGMLVGSSGQDLWYSGQDVRGEATWFSPVFQAPVTGLEDITGLAVQDGTLFVFSRTGIWAVSGEAPSDNGATGGLGTPRRLAVDVGCIDARSIVVTALGVFFQSDRGIELLTRAQSVEWVGQPVQDTTASYPVCTAATLDSAQALVYFELAATESAGQVSGSGRTLVFDLSVKLWVSTDRRKNNAGTADTPAQSAAMVYTGSAWRYAWLGTDGRVYVEDQTTYLDPGNAWVTAKATTTWMHAAGVQGEQSIDRVMLLADHHTGHDLTVDVAFDYVDSVAETETFTAAAIAALSRQWLDLGLSQSTSNAMRVTLSDATPSSGSVGTGKGATWVGLAFPGAAHGGVRRTSGGQRGG